MNFKETFPLRYWLNTARDAEQRGEVAWHLEEVKVDAQRFPAIESRFVAIMALERRKRQQEEIEQEQQAATSLYDNQEEPEHNPRVRGYEDASHYAHALTQRLAIRKARLQGADAVLLIEDKVKFHPNFNALIEQIELPEDWGIFFLGCRHFEKPEPCAPGLVRCKYAVDTHAVAIRAPYYKRVLKALNAYGKPRPNHPLSSAHFIAALAEEIPSYACFPNLAWQAEEKKDKPEAEEQNNYQAAGTQKEGSYFIDRTFSEFAGTPHTTPGHYEPKLGLLFLTREDVNHPDIWREFVAEAPQSVRIFNHPKDPTQPIKGFLAGSAIKENYPTWWGAVTLVNAELALLRSALEDESITHFVLLSESCVPLLPLPEMLRRLKYNPKSRFGWFPKEEWSDLQRSRASHLRQVPTDCMKFHQQWWMMDRIAATWIARADYTKVFAQIPIPDEVYFATVLSLLGYPVEDRVVKQDITWTNWKEKQPSPKSYTTVDEATLLWMVESGSWFARKFPAESDIGKWGLHRSDGNTHKKQHL